MLVHWNGGRHTEIRVARVKTGRYPQDLAPTAVEALRKLAGHWPDKELAVSLNRMRCKTGDGETWTTVRVREMRERLGLPEYDSEKSSGAMISLGKAAQRLGICIGSAKTLALKGVLPAIAAAFTDADPPDAFRRIAAGRAAFRTIDLAELFALFQQLAERLDGDHA